MNQDQTITFTPPFDTIKHLLSDKLFKRPNRNKSINIVQPLSAQEIFDRANIPNMLKGRTITLNIF